MRGFRGLEFAGYEERGQELSAVQGLERGQIIIDQGAIAELGKYNRPASDGIR